MFLLIGNVKCWRLRAFICISRQFLNVRCNEPHTDGFKTWLIMQIGYLKYPQNVDKENERRNMSYSYSPQIQKEMTLAIAWLLCPG